MPLFGVCSSVRNASQAKEQGWDFVEENVTSYFVGQLPDAEYHGLEMARQAALPIRAANALVPGALKITGDATDPAALHRYTQTVVRRAAEAGTQVLVFGSGAARKVPDGFSREQAVAQIRSFAADAAEIGASHGVTIVIEPLHRGQCNILNTVGESMEYVRALNHPNLKCLLDTYHFWTEDEPLDNLRSAADHIRHVHVADRDGRVPPGQSGTSDYRPVFSVLKEAGYSGGISVEASGFDLTRHGAAVLAYLREAWERA
jgi:sugar phosphate isomerase/epimerase